MKIRVPEFVGCKVDTDFPYSTGDKFVFYNKPILVFSSITAPYFNFTKAIEDITFATIKQMEEIKRSYVRYLREKKEYMSNEPVELFTETDEFDDGLLDSINDILFLTDTEKFVEKVKSKPWSSRDQIEYDYEGRLE